jgi:hypothetical protein
VEKDSAGVEGTGMTLVQKQSIFAQRIARLMLWIHEQPGYACTVGEFHRPQFVAEIYQKQGKGSLHSNHIIRLAADLMIFLNGAYLTKSEDYKFAGNYWKSMSTDDAECCWGGDFDNADGNHYSILHEGRK